MDAPTPDPNYEAPKGYWEKLKSVIKANPKGKPLDAQGRFYPDPTPIAPPIGYTPEQSMFDRMRELVRRELSQAAAAGGAETFEEADDFAIEDDIEPFSPYEVILEQLQPDGPLLNPEASPPAEPTPVPPSPGDNPPNQGAVASPPLAPLPPNQGK